LQKALERLGSYVATNQAAADAAQRAADAATTAKERECGNGDPKQRGRFCRDKEDAKRLAADALAKATAAKALTDRAVKLEADTASALPKQATGALRCENCLTSISNNGATIDAAPTKTVQSLPAGSASHQVLTLLAEPHRLFD